MQVTSDDATADTGTLTRRALRARTGATSTVNHPVADSDDSAADAVATVGDATGDAMADADGLGLTDTDDDIVNALDADAAVTPAVWADSESPATAFTWIDADEVEESTLPPELDAAVVRDPGPSVFADARLRPALLRGRWLAPLGTLAALAVAYSTTMLLWPLHEVAPMVEAVDFATAPAAVAAPKWPTAGSAGVSVSGFSSAASTADAASIASLTKVVSSLMVLDELPLQPGEQGPEFSFTYRDNVEYWDYRRANQSSLDVPVGGVLTEYQLLQGTLLGSANNYIDRLAREIWGSDAQFAEAAKIWLSERGLSDITIVTPSGFDEANVATPEALLRLGELAMQNPVFAEIVGTKSVDLPGAGTINNTNGMLADSGVVGIKTGTLVGWCLLTAKDVTIGDTTVRLYASVLNQGSNDERLAVTRSLFAEAEAALTTAAPAVVSGTVVGEVTSPWGARVDVVVDEDATVVLWNGAAADAAVQLDLDDQRTDGDEIGTLELRGPVDTTAVNVSLAENIEGPSPWWRLTHPLDLLGLTAAD